MPGRPSKNPPGARDTDVGHRRSQTSTAPGLRDPLRRTPARECEKTPVVRTTGVFVLGDAEAGVCLSPPYTELEKMELILYVKKYMYIPFMFIHVYMCVYIYMCVCVCVFVHRYICRWMYSDSEEGRIDQQYLFEVYFWYLQ